MKFKLNLNVDDIIVVKKNEFGRGHPSDVAFTLFACIMYCAVVVCR